jgi:hypothetical protein
MPKTSPRERIEVGGGEMNGYFSRDPLNVQGLRAEESNAIPRVSSRADDDSPEEHNISQAWSHDADE